MVAKHSRPGHRPRRRDSRAVRRVTRLISRAVVAAVVVAVVVGALGDEAHAAKRCANVITRHIQGTQVQTFGGYSCRAARALLRRYFVKVVTTAQTNGGCAQIRLSEGCAVGSFICKNSPTTPRGRCSDGVRVVRFHERDLGPE
jgi:hypothetical protein